MAPLAPAAQQMQPWVGNSPAQTIDSANSYAFVWAAGPTAHVVMHLEASSLAGKSLQMCYKLDGKAPVPTGTVFTPDMKGSITTDFALGGLSSGQHNIVVEANDNQNLTTCYYISSGANNGSAAPGISFGF